MPMSLPDGLHQDGEGITRCTQCGGEGVSCRLPDGTAVLATPMGHLHTCDAWRVMLAAIWQATGAGNAGCSGSPRDED